MPPSTTGPSPPLPHQWEEVIGVQIAGTGKEGFTNQPDQALPLWLGWERICLQCGRPGLNPWVGKMPWRRERLPTPVFWPGEFHGLSPRGCRESYTTERVSLPLSRPTKQTDLVGDETLITGGMQGVAH